MTGKAAGSTPAPWPLQLIRVRVLRSFPLRGTRACVGDVIQLPQRDVPALLAAGRVEVLA